MVQTYGEEIMLKLNKLFQKTKKKGNSSLSYENIINLAPKSDKRIARKENYGPQPLMKTERNIFK